MKIKEIYKNQREFFNFIYKLNMLIFLYKLNVLIFKGQQKQNSKGQQSF